MSCFQGFIYGYYSSLAIFCKWENLFFRNLHAVIQKLSFGVKGEVSRRESEEFYLVISRADRLHKQGDLKHIFLYVSWCFLVLLVFPFVFQLVNLESRWRMQRPFLRSQKPCFHPSNILIVLRVSSYQISFVLSYKDMEKMKKQGTTNLYLG